MNIENKEINLILINNKDKTCDVKELSYKDGKAIVTFNNGKTYPNYNYDNTYSYSISPDELI